MIPRRQKWAQTILVIVLLGVANIGVPAIRKLVLAKAGWALVVNESVESADVIVVAMNAHGAGALEAADLAHNVIAARVAFSHTPMIPSLKPSSFVVGSHTKLPTQSRLEN